MSDISLIRCSNYDHEAVEEAVRRAVDLLGGISTMVHPGERVLIKPNLLLATHPDRAVTTHPSVLAAVVRLVKEAGATPLIGDSPGMPLYERVLRVTGVRSVAEELATEISDFSEDPCEVENGDGVHVKRLVLSRAAVEADKLISLPKLKTHGQVYFTGAVKNQFGCVPGLLKAQYHFRFPDRDLFAGALLDINRYLKPKAVLAIMDGIVAMEGNGPSGGSPRDVGVIIAGREFPAVDVVACRTVNIEPMTVPTIRLAYETGFIEGDIGGINVLGAQGEDVIVRDFKRLRVVSSVGRMGPIPEWIGKSLVPKPFPDKELCTMCGACVEACPAVPKAIELTDRGIVINYDRCIRCYCCQEMCPSAAMKLRSGLLARLLSR